MKRWLLVITILLCSHLVFCKTTIKNSRKKLIEWKKKPTKILKSPLEQFSNLPPEDYQFIKELDKQFKVHGDRLKIKVERNNNTLKSSKRNIDGNLGYGYHQEMHNEQTYQFSQPKYMVYPYSQHDIPAAPAALYNSQRPIHQAIFDIFPTKTFEIQESPLVYTSSQQYYEPAVGAGAGTGIVNGYSPHHSQTVTQQVQPLIVLRIPGPSKYATHLQSLLQQYIEIRAAQILKALEESEHNGNAEPNYQQNVYAHEGEQQHHPQHQAQQDYFPPIDQVYQIRGQKPSQQQQNVQHQPEVVYESPPPSSDYAGYHSQQEYQYETQTDVNNYDHNTNSGYQYQIPVYVPENVQQPKPIYGIPTSSVHSHHYHHHHDDDHHIHPLLKTVENNPRDTHTRVHFTDARNDDHSTSYPLPSIKPPTRTIYVEQTNDGDSYQQQHQHQQNDNNYQQLESEYPTDQPTAIVEITQRPFNYHAHRAKPASRGQKRDSSSSVQNSHQTKRFDTIRRIRDSSPEISHKSDSTKK